MRPQPCLVSRAEDTYAATLARDEAAQERAKAQLFAEFMQAASLPALTTVSTPGNVRARIPFTESFMDDMDHALTARVVSILMRTDDGQALIRELAEKHAEFFCVDAAEQWA